MADPTIRNRGKVSYSIWDASRRLGYGATVEEAMRDAGLRPGGRPGVGQRVREPAALARLMLEDYDLL